MTKIKSHLKKRSCTFIVLYYWAKLLGINPLTLKKNNTLEFSYFSIFYGFFLVANYSYIFYSIVMERLKFSFPNETPIALIVNFITISNIFLETSLTWLFFSFSQNYVITIVKSFAKAEKISKKLNIPENYEKCVKKLAIYFGLINVVFINALTFNNYALGHFPNFNTYLWTLYNLPRVVSFNTITIFIWCLIITREKFHELNEKVQFFMENNQTRSDEVQNGIFDGLINPELIRTSSRERILPSDRINIISQLHRELRDLIRRIMGYFGLLVLLNMATQLTTLTLDVYLVYQFIKGHNPIRGMDYFFFAAIFNWLILPLVVLAMIADACGSISDEANKTGNIIYAMLNSCDNIFDTRETGKFIVLALDFLQNQIKLTLFGLFDLDYFLFYRIMAAASSYLVVMLQFYT